MKRAPRLRTTTIAVAYLMDCVAGDPEWFPHPVRLIGRCTEWMESRLRRPAQSANQELVAGAVLTLGVTGFSWLLTAQAIRWARRVHPGVGMATGLLLGWTCLATRNLIDESTAVIRALQRRDLTLARQRLARIVGRDTQALEPHEIHRAVIETLAESACDGVVAPLFYMAAGGVPLAMAYKAVNTLDSMIGHADRQYFYFGKAAARLDDAANYLPARATAAAIALLAGRKSGWRTWWRDGAKHKSPNAGQPESAMAGALCVRLGGDNTYAGELIAGPLFGAEFAQPNLLHTRHAIRLVAAVSLVSVSAAIMFTQWRKR